MIIVSISLDGPTMFPLSFLLGIVFTAGLWLDKNVNMSWLSQDTLLWFFSLFFFSVSGSLFFLLPGLRKVCGSSRNCWTDAISKPKVNRNRNYTWYKLPKSNTDITFLKSRKKWFGQYIFKSYLILMREIKSG